MRRVVFRALCGESESENAICELTVSRKSSIAYTDARLDFGVLCQSELSDLKPRTTQLGIQIESNLSVCRSPEWLTTELVREASGMHALVCDIQEGLKAGRYSGDIRIATSGYAHEPLLVPARVEIRPRFEISPRNITLTPVTAEISLIVISRCKTTDLNPEKIEAPSCPTRRKALGVWQLAKPTVGR